MGYLEGFAVTFRKIAEGVTTRTYRAGRGGRSDQKAPKPERLHGRHVLNRYEDGMEKCIGCELCAGVCPARCIYVRGADNDPDDPTSPGERYGFIYEINYLRCIHCDLCVEACPTQAITAKQIAKIGRRQAKPSWPRSAKMSTAARVSSQPSDSGINSFQPRSINWS